MIMLQFVLIIMEMFCGANLMERQNLIFPSMLNQHTTEDMLLAGVSRYGIVLEFCIYMVKNRQLRKFPLVKEIQYRPCPPKCKCKQSAGNSGSWLYSFRSYECWSTGHQWCFADPEPTVLEMSDGFTHMANRERWRTIWNFYQMDPTSFCGNTSSIDNTGLNDMMLMHVDSGGILLNSLAWDLPVRRRCNAVSFTRILQLFWLDFQITLHPAGLI